MLIRSDFLFSKVKKLKINTHSTCSMCEIMDTLLSLHLVTPCLADPTCNHYLSPAKSLKNKITFYLYSPKSTNHKFTSRY